MTSASSLLLLCGLLAGAGSCLKHARQPRHLQQFPPNQPILFSANQAPSQNSSLEESARQTAVEQLGRLLLGKHPAAGHHHHHHHQQGQQHEHYKTVYACEGNQLELDCPSGRLIHLKRALYGRFSLSICNEHGHSNYSVQCASFRAFLIMETRCNKLSNCSVTASKELFGDPCEGTSKYLEVQYYCHDVNQENGLAGSQPAVRSGEQKAETTRDGPTNNYQASAAPSASESHKSPASGQSQPLDFVGGSAAGRQPGEPASPPQQDSGRLEPSASDGQQSTVIQAGAFCSPQTSSRNLFWNLTRAEQLARQPCPEGSQGRVSWFCESAGGSLSGARFTPAWSPDFSQCRLVWLQNLERQLGRILEPSELLGYSPEVVRHQCEQLNALVLTDLALMARTKDLFSDDLRKLDLVLLQVLRHFRLLSERLPAGGSPLANKALFEDLLAKVVEVVSRLFELSQRNGWLEIQQEELRSQLELHFLGHVREAGLLLSSAWPAGDSLELPSVQRPNVFAGLSALTGSGSLDSTETGQFNLQPGAGRAQPGTFNYLSKLYAPQSLPTAEPIEHNNEFKINTQLVRELISRGATRLLVVEVKKPDYSLIRQHLEASPDSVSANNNLLAEQLHSQVFGLFAIDYTSGKLIKNEDLLQASPDFGKLTAIGGLQQAEVAGKWSELLSKWPISVHFKQLPGASNANKPIQRDCYLLSGEESRCQTVRRNASEHTCRCDAFGFVSLTSQSASVAGQPSLSTNEDLIWETPVPIGQQQPAQDNSLGGATRTGLPVESLVSRAGKPAPTSVWRTILIASSCLLGFLLLAGFLVSGFLRVSSHSRLDKKHNFFSSPNNCNSVFGHPGSLAGEATTGPLPATDVNNLLGGHTMVTSSAPSSNSTCATSHSNSIIGLSAHQAPGCYKPNQQLYASHLAHAGSEDCAGSAWTGRLGAWLRPLGWLADLLASGRPAGKGAQHQGSHAIGAGAFPNGSSLAAALKSPYQNGYTTNLHQPMQQQQLGQSQGSRIALTAAPTSSSTSSYVSSSAYYEEIGPGNLAKLNSNQLTNARALTIVDPFKRPSNVTLDQQQLITGNGQLHWAAQKNAYNEFANKTINDLGQQQQHSSASSHQTTTTCLDLASTPRHYLFASSTAVNLYKSSVGHPVHHYNLHPQAPETNQRF